MGRRNGCQSSPQITTGHGYRLISYAGCEGGANVGLYTLDGEGHEWPGGPKIPAAFAKVPGPQATRLTPTPPYWRFPCSIACRDRGGTTAIPRIGPTRSLALRAGGISEPSACFVLLLVISLLFIVQI